MYVYYADMRRLVKIFRMVVGRVPKLRRRSTERNNILIIRGLSRMTISDVALSLRIKYGRQRAIERQA